MKFVSDSPKLSDIEFTLFYHNVTHKYLDLKINLSELLQILRETYAPLILGGGERRREDSGGFSISENHTYCK
ncbi:hypothetical protein [Leptospira borgpetersenii]|uniref:Uncharacterized protein n=1 Tax=Leptospira borgpetersenii serovar Javanica str. UI 09931 TaxID=1049767 RepID=A0AAV3JEI9_LEPBO|nr:hypothetical protein [Leptospira borgpetersenii]EPG57899.1 hypothetical protein LEP1GSC103_2924 [Leptospira borgpetersenii serovar Javanica str. UI 09931]MDQ7243549.1 hypothetical protein [Leptospira borgpetersenii]PTM49476.1 hypothetical protein CLV95_103159 [Leptospira borgpetersenii serovar Javanica]GIM18137.1 hypothetical protein KHM09_05880 [Leptospira borgpetersenii]GIM21198.1 hypothetical protein KHM19_03810 [Leptospira borgpetersenii]